MAENYSVLLVAWLFVLLLGGCVLINAMVDLMAYELRRWVAARRAAADRLSAGARGIRNG